jgi:hypothetical protein
VLVVAVEAYHQDHLGSVRELTDSVGHVSTIYLADEYGMPTTKQAPSGGTPSDQSFWFTGELFDGGRSAWRAGPSYRRHVFAISAPCHRCGFE